ncbi:MAG: hypothetical protein KJ749_07115 [Planctomycetes bacterium]|nr:hypothetical protein [Planctomycetota bacterium]
MIAPAARAQHSREPEGTALPDYAKVYDVKTALEAGAARDLSGNNLPNIMITGYWPPTNEMLRQFSTSLDQNPEGWVGENWERRGYNVYSFFPEFPAGLGKGEGDFEVDYQDTSADFWQIVAEVNPIAIITTGRADNDYDWELEGGHHMYDLGNWAPDYLVPRYPTEDLPIADETVGNERWSTLPITEIVDAVEAEVPGVYAYSEPIDDSNFLCNFVGYHATWYHDEHADPADPAWNIASGHIHVGYHMTLANAILATEVTVRTLIDYLDTVLPMRGDFDDDRDVDLDDYDAFVLCFTGPGGGPVAGGCEPGDFDGDDDIDCDDWNDFLMAWTEPTGPPQFADCYLPTPILAASPYDVPTNRYVLFDANTTDMVALQVELVASTYFPDSVGSLGWVGEPDADDVSRVVATPFFSDSWPAVVRVGDCRIVPVATYRIMSTNGVATSEPLDISTIARPGTQYWGDVAGSKLEGQWTAPNGVVNFDDVTAAVQTFVVAPAAPPVEWVDIEPAVPNAILNFSDIQQIVYAFQGTPYPFSNPADCS